jgi:uncharacterized protein (TIGR00375 family)
MKIFADLHVHSKYSRATARDLDLENLYRAARVKGIQVVGTGDFSHPAWFGEIEAKLEPAEPGLLRLKQEIAGKLDERVPPSCRGSVRFVLTTEISNIYKKHGRTRKNHNLVFVPDLATAGKLNSRLERIGNIHSDGRPILGLDARDLLEIVLETSPDAFLVPAHIWTPWFSVLGSKSGFDSIAECFGDLAPHVFAAETGLSSDPGMNWRVSGLDDVALISNSDAHSPANLGREANVFKTELSLYAIRDALKGADPERFLGTIEFYPEEGKYHLDGHRACGVCFEPEQTARHQGLCPQCGKPLTIGVLNRVEQLADRPQGVKPEKARPYHNLVPLMGILGEIFQVGAKTQKVSQAYRTAIEKLGPEFAILDQLEVQQIEGAGIPLLAEAVRRMRAKEMQIRPGYDGEYGIVKIFGSQERARMLGQIPLFSAPAADAEAGAVSPRAGRPAGFQVSGAPTAPTPAPAERRPPETVMRLNEDQRKAVVHAAAQLMILAGPGTGKTHTLTCRIAHLIADGQVEPQHILAVTFTHKAAEEMRQRLQAMGSGRAAMPCIATFHSLCLSLLHESNPNEVVALVDEGEQTELVAEALERAMESGCPAALNPSALQTRIVRAKQHLIAPDQGAPAPALPPEEACFRSVYQAYQKLLENQGQLDFEDLIFRVVNRLGSDPQFLAMCRTRFRHIFVDEYQDLNHGQYRLIRVLAPTQGGGSLCVIGDPDQSIYGFRGSDSSYFRRFIEDYPDAGVVTLTRNYRSTETILSASRQVLARDDGDRARIYSNIAGIRTISIRELPNEHAEVEAIARIIESLVGATGFHSIDTGRVKEAQGIDGCGYGDVAVLVRTNQQLRFLAEGLKTSGIPFQAANRRYLLNRKGVVELIALLKLLSGVGGYADAARVAERMAPALGRKALRTFKQWGLENRLPVGDALAAVPRFPIPGLSRGRQVQFSDFAARLAGLSRETAGLTAVDILCRLKGIPEIAHLLDADESREGLRLISAHAEAAGSGPKELLDRLTLQSDTDVYHPRAEKTALMTMHSAKGLEFSVVVIAGCETGFIPFQRASREPVDVDEERRLFYVAMTRSRERLYLTYAKRRRVFGRTENREVSVFVKDIEAGLLKDESPRSKPGRSKAGQLPLF